MSTVIVDGIGFPLERRTGSPAPVRLAEAATQPAPAGRDWENAEKVSRVRINRLVHERLRLRELGCAAGRLERNRRQIVSAQQELGRILIARHYRPAAA